MVLYPFLWNTLSYGLVFMIAILRPRFWHFIRIGLIILFLLYYSVFFSNGKTQDLVNTLLQSVPLWNVWIDISESLFSQSLTVKFTRKMVNVAFLKNLLCWLTSIVVHDNIQLPKHYVQIRPKCQGYFLSPWSYITWQSILLGI